DATGECGGASFGCPDHSLYFQDFVRIRLSRSLVIEELTDPFFDCPRARLLGRSAEHTQELVDVVDEPTGVMVEHGNVAARHVRHMDLMPLLNQTDDGATHADDVVVRVG